MKLYFDKPDSQGCANALARATQMCELRWTPAALMNVNTLGYLELSHSTRNPATCYSGIPYSSVRMRDRFVGMQVSLRTFLSSTADPTSLFFTHDNGDPASFDYHIGVKNSFTYYGTVCSAFVSYCLDMPYCITTYECGIDEHFISASEPSLGAALCTIRSNGRTGGHLRIITGIARDEKGTLRHIEISESIPPLPMRKWYIAAEFYQSLAGQGGSYKIFRARDLDKVTPPEILQPEIFNRVLTCTYGENACVRTGDTVVLHLRGSSSGIRVNGVYFPQAGLPIVTINGVVCRELVLLQVKPGAFCAECTLPNGDTESVYWHTLECPECRPELPMTNIRIMPKANNSYVIDKPQMDFMIETSEGQRIPMMGRIDSDLIRPEFPIASLVEIGKEYPVYRAQIGKPFLVHAKDCQYMALISEECATNAHVIIQNDQVLFYVEEPGAYALKTYAKDEFGTVSSSHVCFVAE